MPEIKYILKILSSLKVLPPEHILSKSKKLSLKLLAPVLVAAVAARPENHAWYGQVGGSAAAFKGIVQLEKGVLKITVGTPGNGGNGSGRNASPGSNGTATTIVLNNITLLTLGGGNGGGGTGDGAYANNGAGGTITVSSKLKIISTKIKTNGKAQSTVSILGNGFGAGGNIRAGTSGLSGYTDSDIFSTT